MKRIANIFMSVSLGFAAVSCDFLDVVPSEFTTDTEVWGDFNMVEEAVAHLYNVLPPSNSDHDFMNSYWGASSEAMDHWENRDIWSINNGSWGPTNIPGSTNGTQDDTWNGRYRDIRRASLLIKNIPSVPIPDNKYDYYLVRAPRLIAEARVLRCYYYFELFKRWGPVPIIRDVVDPEDMNGITELKYYRPSVDEFIDYVVGELDEVIDSRALPETYQNNDYGRVTIGVARALKSRFLLYAASPLYNGNTMYSGVVGPDGKQLFPQTYSRDKWKAAADAAKDWMNMGVDEGGGVYKLATYSEDPTNYVANYAEQFYEREFSESVMCRIMDPNSTVELRLLPNGKSFGGNGKFSPSQELVNSYEMQATGLPITDPDSGYSPDGYSDIRMWDGKRLVDVNVSNMFAGRDPRFYATIFFHGSVWNYDEVGRACYYAYVTGGDNKDVDGWAKRGTNSESGYNVRKWCSPAVNKIQNTGQASRNYPLIRFAEAYLNYAEAQNEYLDAPDQSVYDAINKVRARVGLLPLPITEADKTKEGMRERIRNERRVEFAFELQWFYDVRRWKIAEDTESVPVHGLNVKPTQAELEATGVDPSSDEAGLKCFFQIVEMQDRVFEPKHYLFPIPQKEMDKSRAFLVQNYGW